MFDCSFFYLNLLRSLSKAELIIDKSLILNKVDKKSAKVLIKFCSALMLKISFQVSSMNLLSIYLPC